MARCDGGHTCTSGRSSTMSLTTAPEPNVEYLKTGPDLPPVGVIDKTPISTTARVVFLVLGLVGAGAWYMIAIVRGEHISAVWFVLAAICTYLIAYRFYARLIERKIVKPRDDVATPAELGRASCREKVCTYV